MSEEEIAICQECGKEFSREVGKSTAWCPDCLPGQRQWLACFFVFFIIIISIFAIILFSTLSDEDKDVDVFVVVTNLSSVDKEFRIVVITGEPDYEVIYDNTFLIHIDGTKDFFIDMRNVSKGTRCSLGVFTDTESSLPSPDSMVDSVNFVYDGHRRFWLSGY